MPFKLSPDIATKIADLVADLAAHFDELCADFHSRPADWRASDEGRAARRWINELADLTDCLDAFPEKPEG